MSVEVPATSAYMRVVRLVAGAMSNRAGLDVEEIEDIRIAVSELASVLVAGAPDSARLEVTFVLADGHLSVDGFVPDGRQPVVDDLTGQIIAAVVDDFTVDGAEGARFRMTKSLTSTVAG